MKKNKPNVLFINKSEYNNNKIKLVKKYCIIHNLENPSRKECQG